jgi:hypothetical protein
MDRNEQDKVLQNWESLEPEEQSNILVEYGYYLDTLPPTCSMELKNERFRNWLLAVKAISSP